jgi:hypothetical protein
VQINKSEQRLIAGAIQDALIPARERVQRLELMVFGANSDSLRSLRTQKLGEAQDHVSALEAILGKLAKGDRTGTTVGSPFAE